MKVNLTIVSHNLNIFATKCLKYEQPFPQIFEKHTPSIYWVILRYSSPMTLNENDCHLQFKASNRKCQCTHLEQIMFLFCM